MFPHKKKHFYFLEKFQNPRPIAPLSQGVKLCMGHCCDATRHRRESISAPPKMPDQQKLLEISRSSSFETMKAQKHLEDNFGSDVSRGV